MTGDGMGGSRASRRVFMGTATLSAAALVAGLPARSLLAAGKAPDNVNVAFFLATHPTMLAKSAGWWEQMAGTKITWSEVGSGAEINTAVAAGSVDVGLGIGSSPTAAGISQRIPYEVVALSDNIGPAEDLVVRTAAGIKAPADLRGKKVATPFGSTSHFRLLGLLEKSGLTQKDVSVLDLKPDAEIAAWIRGDIDAAYVWNPARSKMREAGGEPLPTWRGLDAAGYVIADLIIARTAFSKEYPDVVTGLLKAHGRSLEAWRDKPDETAAVIAKEVGVAPDVAKRDLSDYDYVSLQAQLGPEWLGSPGKPGRFCDILKHTADFLVEQKSIRSAPGLDAFQKAVNTTFLEQAAKA
jgi:taurine transport system substrate-binding protein